MKQKWNFLENKSILGQKSRLDVYRKTEITLYTLLDHNGIKLEINRKRNSRAHKSTHKLIEIKQHTTEY